MATATPQNQSSVNERNFRPGTLADFIGQNQLKQTMQLMLHSAKTRQATLEHVAFFGGPGLGKTTLAAIIAHEAGSRLHEIAAPSIGRPGDLASALTMLQPNDILFLDEIHALKRDSAETLYSAMEDFKVSIKLSKDSDPITMKVHPFTLVGSTTDFGLLPSPMRARFGHSFHLQPYTLDELAQIIERAADKMGFFTEEDALTNIAIRSRGTPRVSLRLLRRCVDVAIGMDEDFIDVDLVETTMPILGLDELGLEEADRQYLAALIEIYRGGPAGLGAIAANAGLDMSTAKNIVEPALLLMGLIARTSRGRRVTREGHKHYQTFAANATKVNWTRVEAADQVAD
jgi:holliday junction DNA helicase RuvB